MAQPVTMRWLLGMLVWAAAHCAAPGSAGEPMDAQHHWSFRPLVAPQIPTVADAGRVRTPIDAFIQSALERRGLSLAPAAAPAVLRRRLTYDLIGLPPEPEAVANLDLADFGPEPPVDRWLDELLASPHHGERWGKYWLDAAGYADSNGYFSADTDRPWAYRYRDYVIRATQRDLPFDQFVREQLAGDELAGYSPGQPLTAAQRELLVATHFLRNGQDGTSESDGNPDERTVDRATVLEGTLQITVNCLLGLTVQCARCHDHKFEPISQADYYSLQAIFYPAFPALHADRWLTPVQRVQDLAGEQEHAEWAAAEAAIDQRIADRQREFAAWIQSHRVRGHVLFEDAFETSLEQWSSTVPGDDGPAGSPAVQIGGPTAPAARIAAQSLQIDESGSPGDRWLATRQTIDWTPDVVGSWVQATFDLVDNRLGPDGKPAERIAYLIGLHDFDDSSPTTGGNLLIDGNPAGGAAVHRDYPGTDSDSIGRLGESKYEPGHNYGVRVTNLGAGKFRLEQLVDWQAERPSIDLAASDLPAGAFGFEYCCGRSFVVDNVAIEEGSASTTGQDSERAVQQARESLSRDVQQLNWQRQPKPGVVAFVTDVVVPPPTLHLLERGAYGDPGQAVEPAGLPVLGATPAWTGSADPRTNLNPTLPDGPPQAPQDASDDSAPALRSSGRRLAFARWLTQADSPAAALLARVMVNRIWQYHFGIGLVPSADNFGVSGHPPSHPELLEYLAAEFVRRGWSIHAMHRLICNSAVYQQISDLPRNSSAGDETASRDADNVLLGHFPLRRLDAEAVRDAMLSVADDLDSRMFGPYVPAQRTDDGAVTASDSHAGVRRRSVYLYQRRTQVDTLLQLFDAPSMATICARRSRSTVPLQSLALLNSEFVRRRAASLAARVLAAEQSDENRIGLALMCVAGRAAESAEQQACREFLARQRAAVSASNGPMSEGPMSEGPGSDGAVSDAAVLEHALWTDLCQMLLASNAFLYVE